MSAPSQRHSGEHAPQPSSFAQRAPPGAAPHPRDPSHVEERDGACAPHALTATAESGDGHVGSASQRAAMQRLAPRYLTWISVATNHAPPGLPPLDAEEHVGGVGAALRALGGDAAWRVVAGEDVRGGHARDVCALLSLDALDERYWDQAQLDEEPGLLVVYVGAHGASDGSGALFEGGTLDVSTLERALAESPFAATVLLLDSCHLGGELDHRTARGASAREHMHVTLGAHGGVRDGLFVREFAQQLGAATVRTLHDVFTGMNRHPDLRMACSDECAARHLLLRGSSDERAVAFATGLDALDHQRRIETGTAAQAAHEALSAQTSAAGEAQVLQATRNHQEVLARHEELEAKVDEVADKLDKLDKLDGRTAQMGGVGSTSGAGPGARVVVRVVGGELPARPADFTARDDVLAQLKALVGPRAEPGAATCAFGVVDATRAVGLGGLGGVGKTAVVCELLHMLLDAATRGEDVGVDVIIWANADTHTRVDAHLAAAARDLRVPLPDNITNHDAAVELRKWLEACGLRWLLVLDNADGTGVEECGAEQDGAFAAWLKEYKLEKIAGVLEDEWGIEEVAELDDFGDEDVDKLQSGGLLKAGPAKKLRKALTAIHAAQSTADVAPRTPTASLAVLREHVPKRGGVLLVTSRRQELNALHDGIERVPLGVLGDDDAVALALARSGATGDEHAAVHRVAVEQLGGLPLAIKQAAAVVRHRRWTWAQLGDEFAQRSVDALGGLAERSVERAVRMVWQSSLDAVRMHEHGEACEHVLYVLAQLAPDHVPMSVVAAVLGEHARAEDVAEVLSDLSLVDVHEGGAVSMHRVLQAVVRDEENEDTGEGTSEDEADEGEENDDIEDDEAEEDMLDEVDALLEVWMGVEERGEKLALLPHALHVVRDMGSAHDRDDVALLQRCCAEGLLESGDFVRAEAMARCAVDVLERVEAENEDTLSARMVLACVLRACGRYSAAEHMWRAVLEVKQRVLGAEDEVTLACKANLANVLLECGQHAEAEHMLRDVLEVQQRVLGVGHADTFRTTNNLAIVLRELGQNIEAEQLLRDVVEATARMVGPEHPHLLTAKNNLALQLRTCGEELGVLGEGKLAEAERMLRDVVDVQQRVFGLEHPTTLGVMCNLASMLLANGQSAEAERMLRTVLDAQQRVLGEDHPETLITAGHLANVLTSRGDHADALGVLAAVADAQRRVLGEEHPKTLDTLHMMAGQLDSLGDVAKAVEILSGVLALKARVLGEEHPKTLFTKCRLAKLLHKCGDHAEAERLYRVAVEAQQRVLGPEHLHTLKAMNGLGRVLRDRGQLAEAEQVLRAVLEGRQRVLGPEHLETLDTMNNLATSLRDLTEAERMFRAVLEVEQRVHGKDHARTLVIKESLATVLRRCGQFAEAERVLRAVLEIRSRVLGADHPDTLATMSMLASVLNDLGMWERNHGYQQEAEQMHRAVLEARRRVLGSEHPDTLRSMFDLANLLFHAQRLGEARELVTAVHESGVAIPGTPRFLVQALRDTLGE